ncbi:hypothetical protein EDB84DRAFT_1439408 [Lactarius hengduanensis]|nr:hypothetical protein EDB84DRAFT_1439408 [Lactarius hengduanensis]
MPLSTAKPKGAKAEVHKPDFHIHKGSTVGVPLQPPSFPPRCHPSRHAAAAIPAAATILAAAAIPAAATSPSFLPPCCSRRRVAVVVAVGVARRVGVALRRLLRAVRGWRCGGSCALPAAAAGVGAKGQGVVVSWIACPRRCCPWSRGGGPRARRYLEEDRLEEWLEGKKKKKKNKRTSRVCVCCHDRDRRWPHRRPPPTPLPHVDSDRKPPPPLRCEPHATTHAAWCKPHDDDSHDDDRWHEDGVTTARQRQDDGTARPRHDHGATATRLRRNNGASRPREDYADGRATTARPRRLPRPRPRPRQAAAEAAAAATGRDWRWGGIGDGAGLAIGRDWRRGGTGDAEAAVLLEIFLFT